ncbi:MAG: 4Fe-4S dicluster domain-containing protein [Candidatus Brocadiaceae bacterium]|jgi:2-oxoglutarate ferredoxin oxidoreductase subunit delta
MSKQFEVRILTSFCKGCGLCVEFCDQGKLYIRQKPNKKGIQTAAARPDVPCTGCMRCALMCPDAAVEIVRREEAPVGEGEPGK